jgi:hypothetical protein
MFFSSSNFDGTQVTPVGQRQPEHNQRDMALQDQTGKEKVIGFSLPAPAEQWILLKPGILELLIQFLIEQHEERACFCSGISKSYALDIAHTWNIGNPGLHQPRRSSARHCASAIANSSAA